MPIALINMYDVFPPVTMLLQKNLKFKPLMRCGSFCINFSPKMTRTKNSAQKCSLVLVFILKWEKGNHIFAVIIFLLFIECFNWLLLPYTETQWGRMFMKLIKSKISFIGG